MPKNDTYNTKQKELILNLIKSNKKEFTIKEIYNELDKKVGLTTIYRLVDRLIEENRINKNIGKDNITYYQYMEECNEKNHFYLKCNNCGQLIHVDCNCIEKLSNHLFEEHRFVPMNENVIINGICKECLNKKKSK